MPSSLSLSSFLPSFWQAEPQPGGLSVYVFLFLSYFMLLLPLRAGPRMSNLRGDGCVRQRIELDKSGGVVSPPSDEVFSILSVRLSLSLSVSMATLLETATSFAEPFASNARPVWRRCHAAMPAPPRQHRRRPQRQLQPCPMHDAVHAVMVRDDVRVRCTIRQNDGATQVVCSPPGHSQFAECLCSKSLGSLKPSQAQCVRAAPSVCPCATPRASVGAIFTR